ncbi:MAG: hypothetical protein ABIW76_24585 [Fibrobacteria bacterium]
MPTVRAKFYVTERVEYPNSLFGVKMSPVINGSPENGEFFKWTPAGSLELKTINASAAVRFEVGKEFYVDFTPADPVAST